MTDITTRIIRDTFIRNHPEDVDPKQAADVFDQWLTRHAFQPDPTPDPPTGFDHDKPSGEELDALALASDTAGNAATLVEQVLPAMPRRDMDPLRKAKWELWSASERLQVVLDGYGYKAEDAVGRN